MASRLPAIPRLPWASSVYPFELSDANKGCITCCENSRHELLHFFGNPLELVPRSLRILGEASLVGPLNLLCPLSRCMHTLSLVIRPLLVIALCGAISLGNAPAWLHLGFCSDSHVGTSSQSEPLSAPHCKTVLKTPNAEQCCCHHEKAQQTPCDESGQPVPGKEPHSHSPDDCVLCQSLAHLSGALQLESPLLFSDSLGFESFVAAPTHLTTEDASLPTPRGPPSAV